MKVTSSRGYTLVISEEERRALQHILQWNITVPRAIAEADPHADRAEIVRTMDSFHSALRQAAS